MSREEEMSDVMRDERVVQGAPHVDHVAVPVTISWGAVLGGAVAALALWALLYALGLALGLSTVDANPGSLRSSGVFTGVWGLISPLMALFIGGMIAGAAARVTSKTGGVVHGLVMWGVTTLVGAYGLAMVLSTVVQGVASVGREAVAAGGEAMSEGAGLGAGFRIDAESALRPINERLAAEGKPKITADRLQSAVSEAARQAGREGRLDRELLVQSLTSGTSLSQEDAGEIAARVEQTAQSLQTKALEAAGDTGKAMWGVFGAILLGLLSAMAGATVGEVRSQRRWEDWFSHEPPPRSLHRASV
jgi:hypothetical protein